MESIEGWIRIVIKDLETGELGGALKRQKLYVEFLIPLPRKYKVRS